MDCLPIRLDIYKRVDGTTFDTKRYHHKAQKYHKDLNIDAQCKLDRLDIQSRDHIRLFWL